MANGPSNLDLHTLIATHANEILNKSPEMTDDSYVKKKAFAWLKLHFKVCLFLKGALMAMRQLV